MLRLRIPHQKMSDLPPMTTVHVSTSRPYMCCRIHSAFPFSNSYLHSKSHTLLALGDQITHCTQQGEEEILRKLLVISYRDLVLLPLLGEMLQYVCIPQLVVRDELRRAAAGRSLEMETESLLSSLNSLFNIEHLICGDLEANEAASGNARLSSTSC